MHAHDDGGYGGARQILLQHFFKPGQLIAVKLLAAGAIQKIKRHAAVDPVIVGAQHVIVRRILQTLRAQHGRIKPVGELQEKPLAGFCRSDYFVVADADEIRNIAERLDLVVDVVLPGTALVLVHGHRAGLMFGLMHDVLIDFVSRANVAQMPEKRGVIFLRGFGNSGHHHVAAIARIPRHHKIPGPACRLLRARALRHEPA